ncbi:ABC transporter ATP-binding protein [Clostridium sp. JNZ J1-5]
MIEIINGHKSLSGKSILRDVNISVKKGSIFGLIGPNGAGKTTLIKNIMGIYRLDKGDIKVKGESVFKSTDIKKIMGYVSDENTYFNSFNLKDIAKFYSLTYEKFNRDRFNKLNKIFNLPEKTPTRKFSKGMKMRLSIILNLSIMPEVLILDEPTNGLDPIVKKQFMNILLEDVAERETTILISSHNLGELERICDSIAIMDHGEVKYTNSIEDMKNKIRKIQVVFKDKAPEDLGSWDEIIKVEKIGRVYNIVTKEYNTSFQKKLYDCELMFQEEIDLSLEDMFIYSIGGDIDYEEIFK